MAPRWKRQPSLSLSDEPDAIGETGRALANRARVRKLSGCGSQHPPPRSHACLPQPVGQTGSAGCAGPGDTDLLVADGLGPDLLRDFCQAGDWLPADLRARVTQVEAKPMTSTASANHGARTVGLVTL